MNRLSVERRALILKCLVDGNSMLATSRITGASKNTIKKLLIDVGTACAEYQNKTLRNLPCDTSKLMKFGLFVMPKRKMSLRNSRGSLVMAMFGHLRLLMLKLNLFHLGLLVIVMPIQPLFF